MPYVIAPIGGRIRRLVQVWRGGRGERGGIAVVVAIVLGGGVFMGIGALVVDIGQIYVEREQLQSGADAAAIAVAKDCAATVSTCKSNSLAIARSKASLNAGRDNVSGVTQVCGTAGGTAPGHLDACPAQAGGLTSCIGPAPSTPYVEVRTATEETDGSTLLPPTFAQAMTGNSGWKGKKVAACARATYTGGGTIRTKAITFSQCEFAYITNQNGGVYPPPGKQSGVTIKDSVFRLHAVKAATGCPGSPGNTVPGGFDFMPETASQCHTWVSVGMNLTNVDRTNAEGRCKGGFTASRNQELVLDVSIYDTVTYNSSTDRYTYHIVGLSGFVMTGYKMGGYSDTSVISGSNYCSSSSDRCLYGYFTTSAASTGAASAITIAG